jgi:hypothetical protein
VCSGYFTDGVSLFLCLDGDRPTYAPTELGCHHT